MCMILYRSLRPADHASQSLCPLRTRASAELKNLEEGPEEQYMYTIYITIYIYIYKKGRRRSMEIGTLYGRPVPPLHEAIHR
jgi:hypothetical protein